MSLFGFRNKKASYANEINKLDGFEVSKVYDKESVIFKDSATLKGVSELIEILSSHNIAFAFHDSLFTTISDPGAYLDYSQEKNDKSGYWSMTLGNHGWTGGIYSISNNVVANQLYSLINKRLLSSIRIEGAKIFSHYDKENSRKNDEMIARILKVHSSLNLPNVDTLIFGRYMSESLSSYNIFLLTRDKLSIDKSETWHSKRFTKDGYVFNGENLPNTDFLKTKELLDLIPSEILSYKWKDFYSSGNKLENKLVLRISGNSYGYSRRFIIDNYETDINKLPESIRGFIALIDSKIEGLTAAANTQYSQ